MLCSVCFALIIAFYWTSCSCSSLLYLSFSWLLFVSRSLFLCICLLVYCTVFFPGYICFRSPLLFRFPSFHFLYFFQGLISTLVALDRETRTSHVFTVQATDNGQTPLRGYTSVSCVVTQDLSCSAKSSNKVIYSNYL